MGLRPLAWWHCGFESHRQHGYLSLVSVVCCQVEVSASGWSLVQRSPTECGVSECDREASTVRRPWSTRGCCAVRKKLNKMNPLNTDDRLHYTQKNKFLLHREQTRCPLQRSGWSCLRKHSMSVIRIMRIPYTIHVRQNEMYLKVIAGGTCSCHSAWNG
jgi:hypothetical protein